MRDNLTGTQPAHENLSDWRPTENHALSLGERPDTSAGDPEREFGNPSGAAHEYTEKIAGAVAQARDYLGEKATAIGGKVKDFTKDDLGGIANKAKDFAREKPVQAILVSAGIGMLLGLIVRGRR